MRLSHEANGVNLLMHSGSNKVTNSCINGRAFINPGVTVFPDERYFLGGLTDAAWINLCRVAAQRTQASFWPEPEIYRTGPAQVLCTLTSSVCCRVAAWTIVTRMGVLPALPEPAN